jgi:hypothetical protein
MEMELLFIYVQLIRRFLENLLGQDENWRTVAEVERMGTRGTSAREQEQKK